MKLDGKELGKALPKVEQEPSVRVQNNNHSIILYKKWTGLLIVSENTATELDTVAENEDKPETPVIKSVLLAAHCE